LWPSYISIIKITIDRQLSIKINLKSGNYFWMEGITKGIVNFNEEAQSSIVRRHTSDYSVVIAIALEIVSIALQSGKQAMITLLSLCLLIKIRVLIIELNV